ncbi:MAG: penicillin acylase family protein [Candidatus Nanopelagicales bacterium]
MTAERTAPSRKRRVWLWILGTIGVVLLLLVATASSFAQWTVKRSWPQTDGQIELAGLVSTVDVVRNDLGIPTIYGDSDTDLMFAQGYVHAQDRFWEMDVRRHITAGRLSEMFGESQVPTDSFLRTLGWRLIAEEELGLLSDHSLAMLDAYAAGVNAYLDGRSKPEISLEYTVLSLQNPDYVIEPWVPADSVAWLKALAWDLRGNMSDEIARVVYATTTSIDQAQQVFPPYPYDRNRPIVEGGAVTDGAYVPGSVVSASAAMSVTPDAVPQIADTLLAVEATAKLLDPWLGPTGDGIGSNSWAVSGEHTATGMPILSNDPHLAPAMPSLWYQSGLRCRVDSPDCTLQVAGWTMAGLPGVFIGHTDRFAWGFTNTGPDVTDLVLTKVDGDSYEYDGELIPLTTRTETIKVAGGDPVEITVRSTESGPLISDVAEAGDTFAMVGRDAPVPAPGYAQTPDVDPGSGYAVALRWTALTPAPTFDAFALLNGATDFTGFRAAAKVLAVPAQNLLYADIDGNIGYQMPGVVPVRSGYDGKWPVPGWSSEVSWTGQIPFEELPWTYNPDEGWIVTANQAVISPDYPNFITDDWSYGSRSQRIVDLITGQIDQGRPFTVADMQSIQMDSWSANADFLVPRLQQMPVSPQSSAALALFDGWDYQQTQDSSAAAYFNAFWRQLITRMFDDKTGTEFTTASGDDQYFEVIRNLWESPEDPWWDDATTPQMEGRDATIVASLDAAASELAVLQGTDPADWRWGALHTLLLQNATLGSSGIKPIEMLFNRGPIETSGGSGIVNATGWTPSEGYEVNWVPSMRQVVDLSDFDASTWVNLTGNSGHAYNPNYSDQIDAWQSGQQFAWAWGEAAVASSAEATLTLVPTG